jgi:hypothetical protein
MTREMLDLMLMTCQSEYCHSEANTWLRRIWDRYRVRLRLVAACFGCDWSPWRISRCLVADSDRMVCQRLKWRGYQLPSLATRDYARSWLWSIYPDIYINWLHSSIAFDICSNFRPTAMLAILSQWWSSERWFCKVSDFLFQVLPSLFLWHRRAISRR